MTAIFRTPNFRTEVAASFVKEIADATSRLYVMIGREDDPRGVKYTDGSIFSAGDGQWLDDTNPPTPTNSVEYDRDLWDFAIAGQYVNADDVLFAVPRYNELTTAFGGGSPFEVSVLWEDVKNAVTYSNAASRVYQPFDFSATDGDTNFEAHNILINKDREVYLCVMRGDGPTPTAEGALFELDEADVPYLSADAPSFVADTDYFEDGTNSIITKGTAGAEAKYTWKFICRLEENIWNEVVNEQSSWVPMNFDTNIDVAQLAIDYAGIDSQDAIGDGNAPFILGLRHVMLRSLLTVSTTPGDGLPGDMNFRQVWFVRDPHDSQTDLPATFDYGYMPNSNPAMSPLINVGYADSGSYTLDPTLDEIKMFEKYTGRIIYVENRQPIFRQASQSEEVFTIFSY